ncbi:MAG: ribonuclease III, partial [Burkholderiales bacterium]|nr:ribonuclease III [Burkholderiales bacterium]
MDPALLSLQQRLQHQFSKPALLTRALTHRSASADHNERLEFLGDSVLSLAVSSLLYERL